MSEIRKSIQMLLVPAVICLAVTPVAAANVHAHKVQHAHRMVLTSGLSVCTVPGAHDGVMSRDGELRAQICSELQAGRITPSQATSLMNMVSDVKRTELDFGTKEKSELTLPQLNALRVAQENISQQLHQAVNNPRLVLNPSGVGFNLPYLGYPKGILMPCSAEKAIGSASPWWM